MGRDIFYNSLNVQMVADYVMANLCFSNKMREIWSILDGVAKYYSKVQFVIISIYLIMLVSQPLDVWIGFRYIIR